MKRLFPTSARQRIAQSGLVKAAGKSGGGYLSWFSAKSPETKLMEKRYVTGACMLIRRECYEQVGGLDPGFFMYVDDADYSLRVHQKGWKILYLAEATIVHIKGGTVGERYRWTCAPAYQSMLYFLKKHRGNWAFYISKLFAVTAVFARWLGSTVKSRDERKRSWRWSRKLPTFELHSECAAAEVLWNQTKNENPVHRAVCAVGNQSAVVQSDSAAGEKA